MIETLTANGIATEGVLTTRESNISLAAVTVSPDGEREFLIYRNGSADSTYAPREVATDVIRATRILHVGSLWLGEPICGAAQRHAVQIAPEAAILVSFDVNLRPSLRRNAEEMRAVALEAAEEADILKVSAAELALMAGTPDVEEGVVRLSPRGGALLPSYPAPAAPCSPGTGVGSASPALQSRSSTRSAAGTPSWRACSLILGPQRLTSPRRMASSVLAEAPSPQARSQREPQARWMRCRRRPNARLFYSLLTQSNALSHGHRDRFES